MLTQNETLFEAYAACPPSARIYCSPEIWQSSFAEPSPMLATIWAFEVAAPRAMVVVSDDCASGGLIVSVDTVDCGVPAPDLSSACAQNFGLIASTLECRHIMVLYYHSSVERHDA